MEIPCYFAFTPAGLRQQAGSFRHCAWMACHFSPLSPGLSNAPEALPKGSVLILNDRLPFQHHDPEKICTQLNRILDRFSCSGLLLDFERPRTEPVMALVSMLHEKAVCPMAVPPEYLPSRECPVFLPPVPPDRLPASYFAPWNGREIWLDCSARPLEIRLTPKGAVRQIVSRKPVPAGFPDPRLHCRSTLSLRENEAVFTLCRTMEDQSALLREAADFHCTRGLALFEEYREYGLL